MEKVNSLVNAKAILILGVMFVLMITSIRNDSATMDELAHIPAAFGYVTQFDYRLNPEHPPLLKVLSGISGALGAKPCFPTNTKYWQEYVNGQWDQGWAFSYNAGNNADRIIIWSRIPTILLSILFGWLIFLETKRWFGKTAAIFALTLFAFSPTVLAHSRYVTTDIAAAFGFFIGIITFIRFLETPTRKKLIFAGAVFGIAELLKFSLVLLIPIYAALVIAWVIAVPHLHVHERIRLFIRRAAQSIIIGLIGFGIVWAFYIPFVWNYPMERQYRDAEFDLSSYGFRPAVSADLALIKNKYTRPLGQYVLGVLMVNQRAAGGNTTYYLGEVSAAGARSYFPVLYLLKEPIALHLLTLIAILFALKKINHGTRGTRTREKIERMRLWIWQHFFEFSALFFIAFYWAVSIQSPLNIGVRHILPTLPFAYMLVSRGVVEWLRGERKGNPQDWLDWLWGLYETHIRSIPRFFFVFLLLLWMIASTIAVYPYFLSYYNFLGGGTENGYMIAVDSNYDWGQDLKRLTDYVNENQIDHIAIDYFGGGNPAYYLGDRAEPWWSARGPAHGWFAISATFLQGAHGKTAPGFIRKPEDSYEWLKGYEPIARAGTSIFIYRLP